MAKAVPSDGKNQEVFEKFMEEFERLSDREVKDGLDYFSKKKENGRERMDDIRLPWLYIAGTKFHHRTQGIPAIIKKYTLIKLQQGKNDWGKECVGSSSVKFPWQ